MLRWIGRVILGLIALAIIGFFTVLADRVDRSLNRVTVPGPYIASGAARALHQRLAVVDLHADALLWPRNLLDRHAFGHVDLPRLRDGHVALQVFSSVTKTPRGINYERNSGKTDNITLLAMAERYPFRAWLSLRERARWQATRLQRAVSQSHGDMLLVTRASDVDSLLARRSGNPRLIGALLATEGLHPLEGRLDNLDTLVAAGFRMFGLTHFFDNEVGGSAHGEVRGGLTPFGRLVIARLDSLGLIIDLAHASPKLMDDVLATTRRPVVVSHTGVQATCPGPRNLTDDQLRRIGAGGGLVGIGFWDGAICQVTAASFATAVVHAVQIAGDAHVAVGSDFDGSTTTPFDAGGLALATQALLDAGLGEGQIAGIMGGNALRFLRENLPAR